MLYSCSRLPAVAAVRRAIARRSTWLQQDERRSFATIL